MPSLATAVNTLPALNYLMENSCDMRTSCHWRDSNGATSLAGGYLIRVAPDWRGKRDSSAERGRRGVARRNGHGRQHIKKRLRLRARGRTRGMTLGRVAKHSAAGNADVTASAGRRVKALIAAGGGA